jgi:hypothetical protein
MMSSVATMMRPAAGSAARQQPFDAAVILPTLLRPSLDRAVRSVFAQDFPGRIQLLIGIDVAQGDPAQLAALTRDCPAHIAHDVDRSCENPASARGRRDTWRTRS